MALRDQLTLSLFDDTALLGLTADVPTAAVQPVLNPPTPGEPPEHLPVDYRLTPLAAFTMSSTNSPASPV